MDRGAMTETHEFELQLCEKCGAVIGTKKHLIWLYEKLGPLAYTNPSLLIAKNGELTKKPQDIQKPKDEKPQTADEFARLVLPAAVIKTIITYG